MKNNLPAVHPGCHVKMALDHLDMSNAQAARVLQVSAAYVGDIINGKRNLSASMCYKLAGFIGSTPEHWMALQHQYDMKIAERDRKLLVLKAETGKRFKDYQRKQPAVRRLSVS